MARILTLPSTGSLTINGATGNTLVVDTSTLVVDATNNRVGIKVATPSEALEIEAGKLVLDASAYTSAKFNSQGVDWATFGAAPSIIFNAASSVRPEIAWYRGSRTYPEFAIRQHTTNDTGGEIYVGAGTAAPTLLVALATTGFAVNGNAAKALSMNRHTTANTAGNALTIQSGGATSGATDKAPGDLILATGLGTSAAAPGRVKLQRGGYISPTSGTTDQTLIDCQIIDAHKALSDNVSADLLSCTVAAGTGIGVVIEYNIFVTDLTDHQVETGFVVVSAVNKAATVTRTINEVNSQQAVSAGTLTTTWAVSAAAPAVISLTANTSLTVGSGYMYVTFSVYNHGHQAIALA